MKNLIPSLLLILIFSNQSLAEEAKSKTPNPKTTNPTTSNQQKEITDPDLNLSIEELKKKYPISLLDEKKKSYKPGQKINIDDYSIEEIKAVFLNADGNFVSRKKVQGRGVEIGTASVWIDEEVSVKDQQELIIIGRVCDKLRHSDWSKLNKKWRGLFNFIFSDDLQISYYVMKYVSREEAGFCLDSIEEARGL
jgi:hypothetical protein